MKTKEVLLVGVFAVSLLVLMIGVKFGTRAPPPHSVGAAAEMPAAAAKAAAPWALAHRGGAGGRPDYRPDYRPPAP